METLRDLVDLAKQRQGVKSGRQLAQRAQEHGFQIDRTQLNDMAGGRYKAVPHQTTIEALVWLTGADEDRVRQAAGLAARGETFTPHPDADLLSTEEREVVNDLIRTMTKGRRAPQPDLEQWTAESLAELFEYDETPRFKQGDIFEGVRPDLVYRDGDRVVVVEVKDTSPTGNQVHEALRQALSRISDDEVTVRAVQRRGSYARNTALVVGTGAVGDARDEFIDGLVDAEEARVAEQRARAALQEAVQRHNDAVLGRLDSDEEGEVDDSTDRGA